MTFIVEIFKSVALIYNTQQWTYLHPLIYDFWKDIFLDRSLPLPWLFWCGECPLSLMLPRCGLLAPYPHHAFNACPPSLTCWLIFCYWVNNEFLSSSNAIVDVSFPSSMTHINIELVFWCHKSKYFLNNYTFAYLIISPSNVMTLETYLVALHLKWYILYK